MPVDAPDPDPALPPGPSAPSALQAPLLARDPLGALRRCRARYGPVFTVRTPLGARTVVVADPEPALRLVGGDPEIAAAGAARRSVLPQASARSLFGGDGDAHRALRERSSGPFDGDRLEQRRGAIERIAAEHLATWPAARPTRLLPRARRLLQAVFVREVLGVEDDERAARLVDAMQRVLATPGNPPLTPPDRDVPLVGPVAHAVVERRLRLLRPLLAAELAARRRAGDPGPGLLGTLLRARPSAEADDAVAELLVVLAAAQEPPAIALTRVLERLGRHPDLADELAEAGDAHPRFAAVLDECLRLDPPAMGALRRLRAPLDAGGHRLPAGTDVLVPIGLLHRDPDAFPAPDAFRPERFPDAERPATFLPFGGGRRRCPGERLARLELGVMVPLVLRDRRIRPLTRGHERPVQRATVVVPRRSGLAVAPSRRGSAGRMLARLAVAAAALALVLPAAGPPAADAASAASKERQILQCVNRERATRGLPTLRRSSPLTRAARLHARQMRTKRFFAHEDPAGRGPRERVRRFTSRFTTIGENIAAGNAGAAATCRQWMASPGHRANIRRRGYRVLGVGYATGGPWRHYWVQVFAG
ncbi:cytochrome P450 [Patulibacter brassicae]|uniref:Cytochrome P450 n=1 Tax=Patulibacter brassicae TaxID=1705717 RepID=A0ABU4VKM3_9ACTN|nr:cytochrome P450 [Patulibacter brassicae]MDX8152392.1 cytochrome P450 [Patulibacter brassicae]